MPWLLVEDTAHFTRPKSIGGLLSPVVPSTATRCHCWMLSCTACFPWPTLGLHSDGSLNLCSPLLSSHWAQRRTLGQGTEAIGVFSQSHPQLQLALPHDSPGWSRSQITRPDCPWALGEFRPGLWDIPCHGIWGMAISGHETGPNSILLQIDCALLEGPFELLTFGLRPEKWGRVWGWQRSDLVLKMLCCDFWKHRRGKSGKKWAQIRNLLLSFWLHPGWG